MFGSYYTLGNMFMALVFIWLFSIPIWLTLVLVVVFVFMYCVVSYHGNRRAHKTKHSQCTHQIHCTNVWSLQKWVWLLWGGGAAR